MSFTLNCDTDILAAIGREAEIAGVSRTQYINSLLAAVIQMPRVLTIDGTALDELDAHVRMFNDDVLSKIPTLAKKERRNADQMLLHLVELGMAAVASKAERSGKTRLGLVMPFRKKF